MPIWKNSGFRTQNSGSGVASHGLGERKPLKDTDGGTEEYGEGNKNELENLIPLALFLSSEF